MKKDLRLVFLYTIIVVLLIILMEARFIGTYDHGDGTSGGDNGGGGTEPVMVDADILSRSGFTPEGGTNEETFFIPNEVVTEVSIELTWTDDIGDNDRFRLTVKHEGDEVGIDEGTSGVLTASLDDPVEGALFGNYSIEIEAVDCPGMVGPIPVDRDDGNTWDLQVKATVSDDEGGG